MVPVYHAARAAGGAVPIVMDAAGRDDRAAGIGATGPRHAPLGGQGRTIASVSCPSLQVCYALYYYADSTGNGNKVLTTSNGGRTWHAHPDPLSAVRAANPAINGVLTSLSCPRVRLCYGVGTGRTIMVTSDGGASWRGQRNLAGADTHLTGVSCPRATVCYAVGEGGTIVATTDGGKRTWSSQDSGVTSDFTAVACPSVAVCYAVASDGAIVATTDGGATWSRQMVSGSDNAQAYLADIACGAVRACVVVGPHGLALVTSDGGTTWRPAVAGSADLYGVACARTRACVAAGVNGAIAATRDGQVWAARDSGTSKGLGAVACPSARVCYVGGEDGVILATADGGHSWRAQPNPLH